MSTHNICFRGEIRKILCGYPLLSGYVDTPSYLELYNKQFTFLLQNQQPGAEEAFKILGHAFDLIGDAVCITFDCHSLVYITSKNTHNE